MKHFAIRRRITFYETDAMGVVHHSNYFRFFEEARGAWVRENDLAHSLWYEKNIGFAVIEASSKFLRAAAHNDEIEVRLQVRHEGLRYFFRYAILRIEEGHSPAGRKGPTAASESVSTRIGPRVDGFEVLVTGETVHVALNENFKPTKVPPHFNEIVEKSPWTETWP